MARGGKREGAGRKPGAATVKAREAADRLNAEGLTPLDYLVGVMRGTKTFDPEKFEAAKAAAPYVHPKLAAVEVKGDITTRHDVSDRALSEDEWSAEAPTAH